MQVNSVTRASGTLTSAMQQMNARITNITSGLAAQSNSTKVDVADRMNQFMASGAGVVAEAQRGIGLMRQVNDGLNRAADILGQMQVASMQYVNGAAEDRSAAQATFDQLAGDLDRLAQDTTYGGQEIFGGQFRAGFTLGAADGNPTVVDLSAMRLDSASLGLIAGTMASADTLDAAFAAISSHRQSTWATNAEFQKALQTASTSLSSMSMNPAFTIMNSGMALDMSNAAAAQFSQGGSALVTHSDVQPQSVLHMLR